MAGGEGRAWDVEVERWKMAPVLRVPWGSGRHVRRSSMLLPLYLVFVSLVGAYV